MKKIEEKQKRSKLNEGRDYGIGFSILKPNSDKTKFETFLPFTACRDYLNDFSYVEHVKKEIGSIHGYNHKLLNCFNKNHYFYLGVNTLNYNSGNSWNNREDALTILINNFKNLELLLNTIENKINLFKTRTSIELDEDVLIIKSPSYWNKSTALISVYTLLIRCYFNLKLDTKKDLISQLENHSCFITADNYMKKGCISFLTGKNFSQYKNVDYSKLKIESNSQIHNFGITGYFKKIKNVNADIEE